MTVPRTLSVYIAWIFLVTIIAVFAGCLILIYLIDLAELMRRASNKEELGFLTVAMMGLYKLPGTAERVLPFAVLIGSLAAFHRLSRRHELVVARAAGISVWQFVMPACLVGLFLGVLSVVAYNPLAAYATAQYENLEADHFDGSRRGLLGNLGVNLWLRQANSEGTAVVSAAQGLNYGLDLLGVVVLQFDKDDAFISRVSAERATLEPGRWRLEDAWVTGRDGRPAHVDEHWVETALSRTQVTESLASPSAISFWDLPQFIEIAERAGLTANRYRVHYQALVAQPAFFGAMVLVAALFSIRVTRFAHIMRMVLSGLLVGLALFMANHVSRALGSNGDLAPQVAAWWPIVLTVLVSVTTLFYQEDG